MCCYGDLSKVASTNRKEGLISSHPENYLGNSLKRATTNRAPVSPQDNDKLPQVSTEDNADLGRALTLEEHTAQSPPGWHDGLPVEFDKSFWPDMGEHILAVLSDSLADLPRATTTELQ